MNEKSHRLTRSNDERMVLGVCGGIAQRLEVDPTLVRLAFVVFAFAGPGLLAYGIAALVIPRAPMLQQARVRPALGASGNPYVATATAMVPRPQVALQRR